jgi:hypothetical protein
MPYTDTALPQRTNDRKLKLDPSRRKSKVERLEYMRAMPKRETELPIRAKLRKERPDPRFT